MNLKPIGDKVIVEILKAEDKTKGGIILPDTAKEKPQEAKVIAVGSGKTLENGKVVAPEVLMVKVCAPSIVWVKRMAPAPELVSTVFTPKVTAPL